MPRSCTIHSDHRMSGVWPHLHRELWLDPDTSKMWDASAGEFPPVMIGYPVEIFPESPFPRKFPPVVYGSAHVSGYFMGISRKMAQFFFDGFDEDFAVKKW